MNEQNSDIVKSHSLMERDALKPIQHPRKLHDSDTSIVSYKVPPKNLTPYNQIPD